MPGAGNIGGEDGCKLSIHSGDRSCGVQSLGGYARIQCRDLTSDQSQNPPRVHLSAGGSSLVVPKPSYDIYEDRVGSETFDANAECIFVEFVPAFPLMAAIADDSSAAGEPRWGKDLDKRPFARTIGRFWHGNLPEFLLGLR